jgi:V/A-type H+/Na+-transporting ATPase subunit I
MAIVPLVKTTFYGTAAQKGTVLDGLQRLGCLHLNDLERRPAPGQPTLEAEHTDARAALRWLRDSPVRRPSLPVSEDVDFERVVRETIEVQDRSRALADERDQLRKRIVDLEPWGDFEMPDWARDGRLKFWFYEMPLHRLEALARIERPWRIVARDHRFAYVIAVSADEPPEMPVPPTALDPRSLSAERRRLERVERELEELDYRRIGLTRYIEVVRATLDEADDRAARRDAEQRVRERDRVFAVQGWAPEPRVPALRTFAKQHALAMTVEAPGRAEQPPTLLSNPEAVSGGEGLITFYTTPAYSAWDPSKTVLFAFAVFFAIILADAGYGLVLGGLLAFFWKRLGTSASGRSMRSLMLVVVACSIVYGVITASYFGIELHEGSPLTFLRVLDLNDQRLMMWLSICIGATHLTIANLISAWRRRHTSRALSSIGWAAIIVGGTCMGLAQSYPELAALARMGLGGVVLGAPLVLLFSSEHPFSFAPRQLVGRLLHGLEAVAHSTKAFGDVLSYLRLFALGLAAFKLAEVFNHLAASAFEIKGVGLLLGVLILVVGHGLNLAMGIMSGVVHSLRLNLIEFFSWSLADEGRPFVPYAKKADLMSTSQ